MRDHVERWHDRCTEVIEAFYEIGKRYWPVGLVIGWLGTIISDRLTGWAGGYLDRWGIKVLEEMILSPLLLPCVVIALLLIVAFVQTRKPKPVPPQSSTEIPSWLGKALEFHRQNFSRLILETGSPSLSVWGLFKRKEQYILLFYHYRNTSMFTVIPTGLKGKVSYETEDLLSPSPFIETVGVNYQPEGYGTSWTFTVAVKIPLTPAIAKDISDNIDSGAGFELDLSTVTLTLATRDDSRAAEFGMRLSKATFRDDRLLQMAVGQVDPDVSRGDRGRRFENGRYYIDFGRDDAINGVEASEAI